MTAAALDAATAPVGADGRFRAELSRDWEIWGPNGGYVASLALRAAGEVAAIGRPASISCQFLRAPDFAPVEIEATVLHGGRRSEAIAVRIVQGGRLVSHAIVRTAAVAPGYELAHLRAPAVPGPGELRTVGDAPYPFWANVERRPVPHAGEEATLREWTRFRPVPTFEDPFVDAARALILLDTYGWPAAYGEVGEGGDFVAPSLDINAWFHRPAAGAEWLLIDETCTVGADGLLAAQGHVWDEAGRLIASGGAQLCCLPRP
ncbi:MAG TPA: thioesterase family protein [Solirubrobacterales bacterium]|jgi:acyl-CoA thioesterase-2